MLGTSYDSLIMSSILT